MHTLCVTDDDLSGIDGYRVVPVDSEKTVPSKVTVLKSTYLFYFSFRSHIIMF